MTLRAGAEPRLEERPKKSFLAIMYGEGNKALNTLTKSLGILPRSLEAEKDDTQAFDIVVCVYIP